MWTSAFLLLAAANAWVEHGSTWAWEDTPVSEGFEVNAESFPYEPQEVEAAWSLALDLWNAQGESYVYLRNSGPTDDPRYGGGDNGHNVTRYTAHASGGTLALATWSLFSGDMTDCDIEFYGWNSYGAVDWSFDPAGAPPSAYDFTQTAVHELGHCLGLSHSSVPGARMAPTNSAGTGWDHRFLSADEIGGLQSMYGAGEVALEITSIEASPAAPGPGEVVEVTVRVRNAGGAPSVDVLGVLTAEGPLDLTADADELGDLPPGAAHGTIHDALRFEARVQDSCGTEGATLRVALDDVAGHSVTGALELALDCPAETVGGSGDPEGAGTSAAWTAAPSLGCGCGHAPVPGGALPLAVLLLTLRRPR